MNREDLIAPYARAYPDKEDVERIYIHPIYYEKEEADILLAFGASASQMMSMGVMVMRSKVYIYTHSTIQT